MDVNQAPLVESLDRIVYARAWDLAKLGHVLGSPRSEADETDERERLVFGETVLLSKLEDYGYVSSVTAAGQISKGPNWEEVEPVLTLLLATENPDDAALDSLFDSLVSPRHRYVLASLLDADDGLATIDELGDYVIEQETHLPVPDRADVIISLGHMDLPELADNGLIEYERGCSIVTATDRLEWVEPYLESAQNWEDSDGITG